MACTLFKSHASTHSLPMLPSFSTCSLANSLCYYSFFVHPPQSSLPTMSSTKESLISSITPLTGKNYRSWADNMKSWLQLNGIWHLVSGLERKPAGKAEIRDTAGNVVTPAADIDEDKQEWWEIKAEKAAHALKTAMSSDVKVLIMDHEDDPIFIWDTLKTLFVQQHTASRFNASVKPISSATQSTEITSRVSGIYPFISRPLNATSIALALTDFALPNSLRHRRSSSSIAGAGDNGDATRVRWLACSEGVRDSCRVRLRVGVTGGCVSLCRWVNAVTRSRKAENGCLGQSDHAV